MRLKPVTLVAAMASPAVLMTLIGCATAPTNPLVSQPGATLAGGLPVVQTHHLDAVVVFVVPGERKLALRSVAGTTTTCKAAPQVSNFAQLQAGDRVKATVTTARAIFLVKNGPPPDAGAGVVLSGPAEAGQPTQVILETADSRVRVVKVDPSYRLLTVEYGGGSTKDFKIPLPNNLKNVHPGDEAIMRTTGPLAIRLQPR